MSVNASAGSVHLPVPDSFPQPSRTGRELKSIELFSGAGGMALGVHNVGFRHVALFESDPRPFATLCANVAAGAVDGVSDWTVHGCDVRDVTDFSAFGKVDLVAGGAPCQPFSNAGRREGRQDQRNMIPEFVRAIRQAAPRAFLFENVKGLVNANFLAYFSYVRLQLHFPDMGRLRGETWNGHHRRLLAREASTDRSGLVYDVKWAVMNSADYGVPQARERVFIVGFRHDLGIDYRFPDPTHSRDALLRDQHIGRGYWERHGIRPRCPSPKLDARITRLSRTEPDGRYAWRTVRDAIGHLREPTLRGRAGDPLGHYLYPGARAYHGHTGSDWDWPAKTLKAGAHGVSGGENAVKWPRSAKIRYFTEHEAALLQTFPEFWFFVGGWQPALRQIGNAVPPALAASVAARVYDQLASADQAAAVDGEARGRAA